MAKGWLVDWGLIRDGPLGWALLLFGLAVVALIILVWRRTLARRRGAPSATRERENGAGGRALSAGTAGEERAMGWRPLYPYIKHRRFTRWKPDDMSAFVEEEACPLAIKLFISHRWKTPEAPDPDNKAVPTVVEYLSRVYMAANGLLDANSYLVKELVIGDSLRDAFHERELHRCTCGSVGWLELRDLLAHDDLFFQRVTDINRRRGFYRLLKHVRVWYDYSSLPQARQTAEERAAFDRAFDRLAGIVSQSPALALWGLESIKRAWCVFEVLAAKKAYFCAPAQADFDFTLKAMLRASGYADLAEYRGRPSLSILIEVNSFRSNVAGLDEREIEAYLRKNRIDCTKDEDFGRVARLIRQYLRAEESARSNQ